MNYNPYSLEGKIILITGASSGIGRATAIECSKMGAKLIITGRDEVRLKETFDQLDGIEHKYVIADLTTNEGLTELVNEVDVFNGLVLCAGKVLTAPVPFATRDKFDDIFEINFFSPIELLRLLLKEKKLLKDSSVIFVSSIGGIISFNYGNAIYGASKAAFNSIMKVCAKELAVRKIRVNSVNPGMVETKLANQGSFSQEQKELNIQQYPLKRYGNPEDIAFGIIYLLSDASSWVTGTSLIIDGGISI